VDHAKFDSLTRSLAHQQPRRGLLKTVGVSTLAAWLARFGLEGDAEARKKHKHKRKKCKGNTTKCGKKHCCRPDQTCVNRTCIDNPAPECVNDDDCASNESCENGTCVPVPPECASSEDCASGETCFGRTCVLIAGTCDATDDHCAVEESLCNPSAAGDCFCLQRFGGGAACTQGFVPGSVCGGCTSDDECEALEAGAVCVSPVLTGCPCEAGQGICAHLCPNQ
jgi:hypothetical protein